MLRFYMDEHVPGAITRALRRKGIDVLTVQGDGIAGSLDPAVIERANELGRIVFTNDDDFLKEAARRQRLGIAFAGVIYGHSLNVTIRDCINALELMATASEAWEYVNRVIFLPLR